MIVADGRRLWSVSIVSDILSQMMSTSRSNVCFTLMFSLALVSKNSSPERYKRREENVNKESCMKLGELILVAIV